MPKRTKQGKEIYDRVERDVKLSLLFFAVVVFVGEFLL